MNTPLPDSGSAAAAVCAAIDRQFRIASARPLQELFSEEPRFPALQPPAGSLTGFLQEESGAAGAVDRFVSGYLSLLQQHNQYLQIGQEATRSLEKVYSVYCARLVPLLAGWNKAAVTAEHREHLQLLAGWTRSAVLRQWDSVSAWLKDPRCCGNYSADLQLAVLGLAPETIAAPVLDLGCGREAVLVRRLQRAGIDAWGVDRTVAVSDARILRGDWSTYPLEQRRWRTVISHQGFSNHLQYHYQNRTGELEDWLNFFHRLLSCLDSGAKICYAPGLEWLESVLHPGRFRVVTRPVGGLPFHATQVTVL